MKTGTKYALAGASAGVAAAAAPLACGIYLGKKRRPLEEDDFLRIKDSALVTESGKTVNLLGVDLAATPFVCTKDGEDFDESKDRIFDELAARFGNYGAREIYGKYYENYITKADLKAIRKLGINCVRVPLSSNLVFKEGKLKKTDPDLDRVDRIIDACRKAGIYTILSLESAPGFDGGEDGFESDSKKGFKIRNSVITMWSKIAAYYKDEPAIAAYDILDCGALGIQCAGNVESFSIRAVKAIRNIGDSHIALVQFADLSDDLPKRIEGLNIAAGISRGYCTMREMQDIAAKATLFSEKGIPVVIANLRPSSCATAVSVLYENGIGGVFAGFKGRGEYVFRGNPPVIDLKLDNYESINEKLGDACATKTYMLNEELMSEIKRAASGIVFDKKLETPVKIHYSHGTAYSAGI